MSRSPHVVTVKVDYTQPLCSMWQQSRVWDRRKAVVQKREATMKISRIDVLRDVFASKHRFSLGLLDKTRAEFGEQWTRDFDATLESVFPSNHDLELAVRGYSSFAMDSMRRQKMFEKSLEYPRKSYQEAGQDVYFNESYMESEYLPGLLLSHFLWPHHYRQLRFFDQAFLDPFSRSIEPVFAEIGVGTALYSRRLLERVGEASGFGYDISPSSIRFAERQIGAIGALDRYEARLQDVMETQVEPVLWLVCVEVLEHLEDPIEFLGSLRSSLRQGGKAFITAALNAAHADHIYLYREVRDVEKHLLAAGFGIEQSFAATAYGPKDPGIPVPMAAAFVVCP